MKIVLYKYSGQTNKINKTLSTSIELQGYLKEETSLLSPSFIIEYIAFDNVVEDNGIKVGYDNNGTFEKIQYENDLNRLLNYNYAYIPDFNRYYFITNISSYRTNLWRIDMKVDVLMSYANEINNQNEFITRYEGADPYVYKDELAVYDSVNIVKETEVEDGVLVNTKFNNLVTDAPCNVVVSTISTRGLLGTYSDKPSFSILPEVDGNFLLNPCTTTWVLKSNSDITHLAYDLSLSDYSKYSSYIMSAVRFPMEIPHSPAMQECLYVSDENQNIPNIYNYFTEFKNYIVADFTYVNSNITKDIYELATIEIYVPYLGWVRLNTQDVMNERLVITYDVDYYTGESNVSIINYNKERLLYYGQCQVGTQLSLISSDKFDVDANNALRFLNMGVNIGTTTALALSGNYVGASMGIVKNIKSIGDTITGYMTNYAQTSGSVTNTISGIVTPQKVRVKATYPHRVNRTDYFAKNFGYPYNSNITLKFLNDNKYFKCSDVQLTSLDNATKVEQEEIKNLLEQGVYK